MFVLSVCKKNSLAEVVHFVAVPMLQKLVRNSFLCTFYYPGGVTSVYVGQPMDTIKVKMFL